MIELPTFEFCDVVIDHLLTSLLPLNEKLEVIVLIDAWVVCSVEWEENEGDVDENGDYAPQLLRAKHSLSKLSL